MYGIDEEKLDGKQSDDKSWVKTGPALSAAEALTKKKKKKVFIAILIFNDQPAIKTIADMLRENDVSFTL